jgi:hypothetical protein
VRGDGSNFRAHSGHIQGIFRLQLETSAKLHGRYRRTFLKTLKTEKSLRSAKNRGGAHKPGYYFKVIFQSHISKSPVAAVYYISKAPVAAVYYISKSPVAAVYYVSKA